MILKTSLIFMHASSIIEINTQLTHLNTSIIYQLKTLKPELPRHSTDRIVYLETHRFNPNLQVNLLLIFLIHPNSNLIVELGFMHNSENHLQISN